MLCLYLVANIYDFWHPEIRFKLLPLEMEKNEMLCAQLRDAKEELAVLSSKYDDLCCKYNELMILTRDLQQQVVVLNQGLSSPTFTKLFAKTGFELDKFIVWSDARENPQDFLLCRDNRQVTVQRKGLYFISVRLGLTQSEHMEATLSLHINNEVLASHIIPCQKVNASHSRPFPRRLASPPFPPASLTSPQKPLGRCNHWPAQQLTDVIHLEENTVISVSLHWRQESTGTSGPPATSCQLTIAMLQKFRK